MGMFILGLLRLPRNALKEGGYPVGHPPSSLLCHGASIDLDVSNLHALIGVMCADEGIPNIIGLFRHLAEGRAALGLGGSSLDRILEHCWLRRRRAGKKSIRRPTPRPPPLPPKQD